MSSVSSARVIRIITSSEASHWRAVIERCQKGEAQTLKADGATRVLLLPGLPAGDTRGSDLIVKRWELRGLATHLKSLLRASRAWRHWRGAERLTSTGVRTARCHAILRTSDGGPVEWLIMERLPGKTLLRHMADRDLTVQQEHALADALGAAIGKLAKSRIYNRDGKPSNWIVTDPANADLAVVDTVGIRRGHGPRLSAMLTSLMLEAIGCGIVPRRSLRWRTVRSFDRALGMTLGNRPLSIAKDLWAWTTEDITEHGDPTPKVNPLGDPSAPETGLPLQ